MFLNFLEGPGWIILSVLGGVMLFNNWFRLNPAAPIQKSPNWNLVASSIIVAFLFGILLAIYSSGSLPNVITGWGSQDNRYCTAAIDMTKLITFKRNYKLAVVCGYQDLTKDTLEDESITVSNPFTITPGAVQILTPLRPVMVQKLQQTIGEAQAASGKADASVSIPVWYYPILIPTELSVAKITKLGDVLNLGGKILNPQYY